MATVGTLELDAVVHVHEEHHEAPGGYTGYAVLEIMGHRRIAGYVRHHQIGEVTFLRIDSEASDGTLITQFYHPNSLFSLSPCDVHTAQLVGRDVDSSPIQLYQVRDLVRQGVEAELARRAEFAAHVAEHAARHADDTEDDRDDTADLPF